MSSLPVDHAMQALETIRIIASKGEELVGEWNLARATLTIGRSPTQVDITLRDRTISRKHCKVETRGDELWIVDLGSANGCWVNGRRIQEVRVLPTDVISVGHIRLKMRHAEPAEHTVISPEPALSVVPTFLVEPPAKPPEAPTAPAPAAPALAVVPESADFPMDTAIIPAVEQAEIQREVSISIDLEPDAEKPTTTSATVASAEPVVGAVRTAPVFAPVAPVAPAGAPAGAAAAPAEPVSVLPASKPFSSVARRKRMSHTTVMMLAGGAVVLTLGFMIVAVVATVLHFAR
jgi:predicted component of type VI protein secretion system